MAKKNKDKDEEDRPKAPPPAPQKKEEKKEDAVAAPVTYAGSSGQKTLLRVGLVLIIAGSISSHWWGSSGSGKGDSDQSKIVMCGGLGKPELTVRSSPVRQKVRSDCFSGVIVAPSARKDKVVWHAPGKVDVCFWRANRCVAWMHIGDNETQEVLRGEVPDDYTVLFFKGDPGDLEVILSR